MEIDLTLSHNAGAWECLDAPFESEGWPSAGTCTSLPSLPAQVRPFLSCLNYSNAALCRVQDFCLFRPPLCPQYLEYLLNSLLRVLTHLFTLQSHYHHGFFPSRKSLSCLKAFPYRTRVPAPKWEKHGLSESGPHLPTGIISHHHATHTQGIWKSSQFPDFFCFSALVSVLFSPLHKMPGHSFALANTHQFHVQLKCMSYVKVLSSKYPVALGSFCKVL